MEGFYGYNPSDGGIVGTIWLYGSTNTASFSAVITYVDYIPDRTGRFFLIIFECFFYYAPKIKPLSNT